MEERYEGLSLRFGDNPELKEQILSAIEKAKEETGKTPMVFETISKDHPETQGIYVEFNEDVQREAGDFFEKVLHRLNIVCEKDS
jgi:hypothetical protein